MKRFVFTLQSLLSIKLALEKEQKAELAACDALLRRLEEELQALSAAFESMRLEYEERARQGIPVAKANDYSNALDHTRTLIAAKRDELAAAEMKRLQVRLKLVEIMREIKVFEKLREKQYEEYQKEVRAEEDKLIGDILSYRVTIS